MLDMKYLLALFIPTILLYGCADDDPLPITVTPNGYRISFKDQGSSALMDVAVEFDKAVDAAVAELTVEYYGVPYYGLTEAQVRTAVSSYVWTIIDHFRFYSLSSHTGWASGQIAVGHWAMLALYSRRRDATGPSWTIIEWGTGYQSADLSGMMLPALSHELLHHFGLIEGEHSP